MKTLVPGVGKHPAWKIALEKIRKLEKEWPAPIESGILETVVVLNALGFHTTASCEGHAYRHRACTSYPWICFNSTFGVGLEQNTRWEYFLEMNTKKSLKGKMGLSACEYREYKKINDFRVKEEKKVFIEINILLNEFYSDTRPDPVSRLVVGAYGWPWLQPKATVGESYIRQRGKTADIEARLRLFQAEMQRFTKFLEMKLLEK